VTRRRGRTLAQRADPYRLYQEAVQEPDADVPRLRRMYRNRFGRRPRVLREDFCGSALLACRWVRSGPQMRALGVDLDPRPLAWGRAHNLAALRPSQAARVRLVRGDVLRVRGTPADVLVAFNFSYSVFKTRAALLRYFRRARANLAREGLFVLDAYGGTEAQERRLETRRYNGFRYVWDQDLFDPITHHTLCRIHFEFPDGSRLARAFEYDWRLWMVPELRECLAEAGFDAVEVYWEGTDRARNEPNGVFTPRTSAADDPAWIAYLVGIKGARRGGRAAARSARASAPSRR
jgi:hypothetical protein